MMFGMIALANGTLGAAECRAVEYHPEALVRIGRQVATWRTMGVTPVVLFDIDDTLTNSRVRTVSILRDLSREADFQARFPEAARRLATAEPAQVRYEMADTLKQFGLDDPEVTRAAAAYWLPRFFSNRCAGDRPIAGAVGYTRWLQSLGAKIVYLTGRDSPRMGVGTVIGLRQWGFPVEPPRAILMLKQDKDQPDVEFKQQSFARIRTLGPVIAVFENEPRNINAMVAAFPRALPIFVDSLHSTAPDVPGPTVLWVRDLQRP